MLQLILVTNDQSLGDSVSQSGAKNCGGSVLLARRIPNRHIYENKRQRRLPESQIFRFRALLRRHQIGMVRREARKAIAR